MAVRFAYSESESLVLVAGIRVVIVIAGAGDEDLARPAEAGSPAVVEVETGEWVGVVVAAG